MSDFEDDWATLGAQLGWQTGTTLGSPVGRSGTLPALPTMELAGDTAQLELGAPLGEGAIGLVLEARQVALDRSVAVKCLREAREDDAAVLVREARLAGRLEHPNIVPIHTLGADASGYPMVVMKRVKGQSWRAHLAISPPLEESLRVLAQVCHAVHFAHGRGVLHRDLKPDNVMLGAHGEVYVVDWGLALEVDGASTEALAGTPGYLAPEMCRVGAPQDPRTDVYLLGAVLHEVLTGQRRHRGADLEAICRAAWVSAPVDYGPEVPGPLAALANRACARDPAHRPASVEALRVALEDYLLHRQAHALTFEAQEQLEALRAAPGEEALFGAARFGFEAALRIWPESEEARAGLEETLRLRIEADLERGEAGAAARLLRSLPTEDPELDVRISQERAAFANLRAERDSTRGTPARLSFHVFLGFVFGVLPFLAGRLRALEVLPPPAPPFQRALAPLIVAAVVALALRARPSYLEAPYNRRIAAGIVFLLFGASFTWIITGFNGGGLQMALSLNLINAAVLTATFGLLLDPRFFPLVAFSASGALSCASLGYPEETLGVVNLACIGWLYRGWSQGRSKPSFSILR